jgi:uncharacterized protein (DUF58 family)
VLQTGWLLLAVLVLLASVVARDGLLFLLSLTVLAAAGVSRLWGRYCLERVEYRRRLSQPRAAWGDEVDLELEVVNRKALPLAWLEVQEELPAALGPARASVRRSHLSGRSLLTALFTLRWYERVRRRYRVACLARGDHWFGPTVLRSGDVFGFETRERLIATQDRLIVYPRVVPVDRLGLPAADPLGERATRDWLFQDPLRTVGLREYVRGDSQRRIHWGATARTGALQVRRSAKAGGAATTPSCSSWRSRPPPRSPPGRSRSGGRLASTATRSSRARPAGSPCRPAATPTS